MQITFLTLYLQRTCQRGRWQQGGSAAAPSHIAPCCSAPTASSTGPLKSTASLPSSAPPLLQPPQPWRAMCDARYDSEPLTRSAGWGSCTQLHNRPPCAAGRRTCKPQSMQHSLQHTNSACLSLHQPDAKDLLDPTRLKKMHQPNKIIRNQSHAHSMCPASGQHIVTLTWSYLLR